MQSFVPRFQLYYFAGLAFYTQALLSLLLLDKPRSDYWEYLIHHLVTIFLISVSFYTRIQRCAATAYPYGDGPLSYNYKLTVVVAVLACRAEVGVKVEKEGDPTVEEIDIPVVDLIEGDPEVVAETDTVAEDHGLLMTEKDIQGGSTQGRGQGPGGDDTRAAAGAEATAKKGEPS